MTNSPWKGYGGVDLLAWYQWFSTLAAYEKCLRSFAKMPSLHPDQINQNLDVRPRSLYFSSPHDTFNMQAKLKTTELGGKAATSSLSDWKAASLKEDSISRPLDC